MLKYVPIFNLFRVILFMSVMFSQGYVVKTSDGFVLLIDSSLTVSPYLKSLLNSNHSWGDSYKLTEFKQGNPTKITYDLIREKIHIDSLFIIYQENVQPKVLTRFFLPLKKVQSLQEVNATIHNLKQTYKFVKSETNVTIARYSEKKLLAVVNPELHFENHFSGIFGLSNEKNTLALSGDMEFHFENLWKTTGTIDIRLKRWKAESEKLFLSLKEPFIFRLPFGAKLEYHYEVNEGYYVKTQSSLGILSRGSDIGNWEFSGANTQIEPTETGREIGLNFLKEHSFSVTHSFGLQKQKWQSKQGLNMHSTVSLGRLSVLNESHAMWEMNHLTEMIHLLTFKSGIKEKIEFMGLWSSRDSLEWSQMIRFGGVRNLRGYRENQFFSEWVILPSIEFFYYATNKTSLSIFTEGAIQENYKPHPWNYGFSLEQKYSTNHVTISLAWGRDDSFSQGKVHINFVNIL